MPAQVSLHSTGINTVKAVYTLFRYLDLSLVKIIISSRGMTVCQGKNTTKIMIVEKRRHLEGKTLLSEGTTQLLTPSLAKIILMQNPRPCPPILLEFDPHDSSYSFVNCSPLDATLVLPRHKY